MNTPTQSFPLFRLLAGSVCISFSPVFIKLADVDPDLAGFYRMLFAALGLLPLFLIRGAKLTLGGKALALLAVSAVALGIDFMFWHRSINLVGPGLATLMGNFQIFFTAFFSWLLLKERISGFFLLAVVMAVAGLLLITGIDFPALTRETRLGVLFGLLTAVFYSAYILSIKQAMTGGQVSGITAVFVVTLICGSFLALVNLAMRTSFALVTWPSIWALAAVGIVCTALGWSLISSAMKQVPATLAGLVLLLQPALSFCWDVLFFHRVTGGEEYLGIGLILTAIYLGSLRRGERGSASGSQRATNIATDENRQVRTDRRFRQ